MSRRELRQNRLNLTNSPTAKFLGRDDSKNRSTQHLGTTKSFYVKNNSHRNTDYSYNLGMNQTGSSDMSVSQFNFKRDSSPTDLRITVKDKDQKFQQLLDRIVEKESDKVYDPPTPKNLPALVVNEALKTYSTTEMSSPSSLKVRNILSSTPENALKFKRNFDLSDSINKSKFNQSRDVYQSLDEFSPSKKNSRFSEIVNLRKQKAYLEKQNSILHQNLEELDEFELILKKKTRIEDFNERRCDILKACIQKQKRYIDLMNTSIKLSKKFYKDLVNVLRFLGDMHRKYIVQPNNQTPISMQRNDGHYEIARKTISEILEENGNVDYVKQFIKNFNEAYTKVKASHEKSEEVNKLFNLTKDIMKGGHSFFTKMNPEVQKKIKYNYMFSQFIKDNKRFFPIYTVFNEFDLKDKNDFSEFMGHLVKMMDKTDEVFKKIKNFSIMKHSHFTYNEDIPENLIDRAVDFDYYFNTSNQKKRVYLNSKQIFDVERNLSVLLSQLMTFHSTLLNSKDGVTVKMVQELQENLRNNIESLLLLGINSTADLRKKDKLVVIHDDFLRTPDALKPDQDVEKRILFEIYNEEIEKYKNFEKEKGAILGLIEDTTIQLKDNNAIKSNLKNLKYLAEDLTLKYEDMELISSLKQTELRFCREYTRMITRDIELMERKVNDKMRVFQDFLKKIEINMDSINRLVEKTFNTSLNPIEAKEKSEFYISYKMSSKEILNSLNDVLSHHPETAASDVLLLKDNFKKDLEDLRRSYSHNSDKVNAIKTNLKKS